ncbi:MAG: replication initiator [Acidimicrobiales bacterium]
MNNNFRQYGNVRRQWSWLPLEWSAGPVFVTDNPSFPLDGCVSFCDARRKSSQSGYHVALRTTQILSAHPRDANDSRRDPTVAAVPRQDVRVDYRVHTHEVLRVEQLRFAHDVQDLSNDHALDDLSARGVSAHVHRLVETTWNLGTLAHLPRLRAWAHSLGFGGHWLTTSRHYSVTFSFLRSQRQAWQVQRSQGTANPSSPVIGLGVWKWVGTRWRTAGDEWIAALRQTASVESRREARDARRCEAETVTGIEHQWTSESSRTSMSSRATTSPNIAKDEMSNDRREGSDEGE